ncbi:hypothetical protein HAX54_031861 [Datura stramonium]|uniref:AB hydrolase-1 domain-containing protein n=1 Tax=Datura stramonium TaxID=4076 RepID=A0ABS8SCC0_DATST|nr:hypothetical protein [Datura stramonium]
MALVIHQRNIGRSAIQIASAFRQCHISYHDDVPCCVRVFSSINSRKVSNKPSICTADELHYVSLNTCDWRLALWRYLPHPQAPRRNHPLLLLSGVGTNAIGYDLSPESSFARYMCNQGFDTWILEVRGTGLSVQESDSKNIEKSAHTASNEIEAAADNANDRGLSAAQQSTNIQGASEKYSASLVNEEPIVVSTVWGESRLVTKFTETFIRLSERVSGFVSGSQSKIVFAELVNRISKLLEDSFLYKRVDTIRKKLFSLLEMKENSAVVTSQVGELSKKLVNIFEGGHRSVSSPLFDLQERLTTTMGDFQEQLGLILKYDWDFDNYLEEDVPAAMEYIKAQNRPKDDKLLAIGHSMGGILLYARLSRCVTAVIKLVLQTSFMSQGILSKLCQSSLLYSLVSSPPIAGLIPPSLFNIMNLSESDLKKRRLEGREPGLAAIVTLASSLDYTSSKSALKLLVPLADPAQVLNVPVIPLGALLAAAYPLTSRAPYALAWLNEMISATDMMHPDQLKKLLTTAFQERGLRDRSGKIFYKDHLHKSSVPVLALAGDLDQICPSEAVYETVKLIPENLVNYKVFGEADGPHYAHYDLVGGHMAAEQLYPCVVQFLSRYDGTS